MDKMRFDRIDLINLLKKARKNIANVEKDKVVKIKSFFIEKMEKDIRYAENQILQGKKDLAKARGELKKFNSLKTEKEIEEYNTRQYGYYTSYTDRQLVCLSEIDAFIAALTQSGAKNYSLKLEDFTHFGLNKVVDIKEDNQ